MRRFVLRSSSLYSCNNLLAFSNELVCSVSSFESQSSFTLSILEFLSDASNLAPEAFSSSCKFHNFSRCPSFTVDSPLKFSSSYISSASLISYILPDAEAKETSKSKKDKNSSKAAIQSFLPISLQNVNVQNRNV